MRHTITCLFAGLIAATMAFAAPAARAQDGMTAAEELVEKARLTVMRIPREEEMRHTVPNLMRQAKAIVVFPTLLKGAFFIGGQGGSGVLMTRDASGVWSHPAFYTMGSVSFGLQIGGQASEAILVIMSDKGLKAVMDNQVKLGADISAAAGPVGMGASAATTTAFGADIYTYSMTQGLFIGGSLDGAVIARRDDWNESFYGPGATVNAIVNERRFGNRKSDPLREAVAEVTGSGMGSGTPMQPAQAPQGGPVQLQDNSMQSGASTYRGPIETQPLQVDRPR